MNEYKLADSKTPTQNSKHKYNYYHQLKATIVEIMINDQSIFGFLGLFIIATSCILLDIFIDSHTGYFIGFLLLMMFPPTGLIILIISIPIGYIIGYIVYTRIYLLYLVTIMTLNILGLLPNSIYKKLI